MNSGTLPPIVGSFTTFPRAASAVRTTSCEIGKSMDVRRAAYPPRSTTTRASFGVAIRVLASGSFSTTV